MMLNLKVMGLALLVVLSLGALGAGGAGAATFTNGNADTIITGSQKTTGVYSLTGLEVQCKKVSFVGTSGEKVQVSITITPKYEECFAETFIGTINVTVTGFGAGECDYRINASGTADLECAAGKEVTVDAATCTVHIPAQTGSGTLKFTNESVALVDITINITIINTTVSHTDGFACPFNGSGEGTNATVTGSTTVTGEDASGAQVSISWDA